MKKPSKALVNKHQEFSFNPKALDQSDIQKIEENEFHLIHENKSYRAKLIESNFLDRSYCLQINSSIYSVKIKRPIDDVIEKMGYSDGSSKIINSINAPMPGIIIDIKVKEGQTVKEGDTLLILEAMKMENAILSPKDASIKKIHTDVGDTVDKNKLLIDFK
ncbi:acetyl-CoA carboxylase biotin carboxyl carrier protein subunit [Lutimonas sp.]|uniref:acetyl-CoA carboxylase biotin carboxyl carrier protein subunit n=1 Tax=Lutimonas sp. TaxID=1872403 RepID=UPI003D9B59CB